MTTPLGVPNLPPGALTLPTLGSLQDQSATALRGAASAWMPGIFNASTGGNILSDLSPFGIVTRIWAEVVAAIAAADPRDIDGPEDLPGLLNDFIEGLPVVGQLIGLLQAILGLYEGNDAVLLAVQQIFMPIRKLMQLITGQDVGFPTVEEVTAGWEALGPAIAEQAEAIAAQAEDWLAFVAATGQANFTALASNLQTLIGWQSGIPSGLLAGTIPGDVKIGSQAISGIFNGAGQFIGELSSTATGALNPLITVDGQAVGTVKANASAALTGAIDIAQGVQDAITGGTSMLSALGAQVVNQFQGMFGWWMGAINNNAVSSASSAALREALAAQQSHIGKNTSDINDILAALASVADGGANSLDDAVTFTLGTLPAEFTAQSGVGTVSAIYNLADAPTDAMTVSMVFSKPPAPGTHYEIVLRADATFNTCVWMEVGLTDILVKCKAGGITSTLYTLNTPTIIGAEVVSPFFRTGSPYTFSVDDEFNFRMSFFSKGFGAMQTGYWVRTATFTDGGGGTPTSVKGLLYRKAGYGTDEAALPGSVDGWAIYGPGIEPGSYSTRPATANEGDEFYPNDTGFFSRYIDGEWINIGRVFRRKEPPATGWAWVNQGDASINTDRGAQLLIAPSGLRNWRLRERNKPAGSSWAVEAELEILGNVVPSNPYQWHAGIGIRNPTSGQFVWFGYINSSTGMSLQVGIWANVTTFTSSSLTWGAYNALMLDAVPKRLKIRDNGTNLFFEYTHNDINWYALPVLFGTTNSTAFTKVFFGADNEGTGQDEIVRLIHWDE